MKMLSLFSGIGGIDLAAQWAGIETVAFCEQDKFCQKILDKHWPGVPCYDDIKTLKGSEILARHGRIDIVAGGFPCQPFSQAGKRRGAADDRHLWPEMFRIIKEVRPTWIVGENVVGIVGMVLDDVLDDLEKENYETQSFIIPACGVGAWHRRYRVFVVAHSSIKRKGKLPIQQGRSLEANSNIDGHGEDVSNADQLDDHNSRHGAGKISQLETSEILQHNVSNANESRLQGYGELRERAGEWLTWKGRRPFQNIWESEPDVGRLAHGVPDRVAKLKALGNAVVPQQIYPIFKAIKEIEDYERMEKHD